MTDITKYKSVAIDHDCYSKIKKLSEKLCPGAKLSLAAVVRILVNNKFSFVELADDEYLDSGSLN
jgi:hypothetical protein|tara:strand:+ start:2408 stop:2602 length:195 start_codon:yes stop_codon:yes gene_type:complete